MIQSNQKGRMMFEKILNVLSQNLGYTVVFAISIVLFSVFSDGLVAGIITALSALLAYACVAALYKEYKKTASHKPVSGKKKAKK